MTNNFVFRIEYMGHELDEFDTAEEAENARSILVKQVMSDKLPNFLTSEDFENFEDCDNQIVVVMYEEGVC